MVKWRSNIARSQTSKFRSKSRFLGGSVLSLGHVEIEVPVRQLGEVLSLKLVDMWIENSSVQV